MGSLAWDPPFHLHPAHPPLFSVGSGGQQGGCAPTMAPALGDERVDVGPRNLKFADQALALGDEFDET